MRTLLCLAAVSWLIGCHPDAAPLSNARRQAIATSVDSATRAFEAVQRSLDPDAAIGHLAPEFYMYADGRRLGYDSVVTSIRRSFHAARQVEPGFRNIEVIVQGPDAALASFEFRDSVVDTVGAVQRFRGATTLAWARRGSDWLIVYADADHYDAPVYYERALAAEAIGRTDVARSHYAQFLRRYDSPIDAHRDLVERAERIMREAPSSRVHRSGRSEPERVR